MSEMSDYEVISRALSMWKNHMETGSVIMSKEDAINAGQKEQVKSLDDNQIQFTQRLKKMSLRALDIDSQKRRQG